LDTDQANPNLIVPPREVALPGKVVTADLVVRLLAAQIEYRYSLVGISRVIRTVGVPPNHEEH
jgi:hypothetical protein